MFPDNIFHDDSINGDISSGQYIFIDKFFPHELIEDVFLFVSDFWQERVVWVDFMLEGLQLL